LFFRFVQVTQAQCECIEVKIFQLLKNTIFRGLYVRLTMSNKLPRLNIVETNKQTNLTIKQQHQLIN